MASIINATTSTGLVSSADNSGSLQLATNNGTTAVTIDTSQRVGVGTTSPTGKLHVYGSGEVQTLQRSSGSANNYTLFKTESGADQAYLGFSDAGVNDFAIYNVQNGYVRIATNNTERMRISSAGILQVNTTASAPSIGSDAKLMVKGNDGVIDCYSNSNGGGYYCITFKNNNANNSGVQGYITINTTSVAYTSVSDYRLKENVQPMTGALAKVSQLKPVTYTWKTDGSNGQGFIAHELQEVVPEAVTGEKDAVNNDGSIKAQGVDTSFLVATLTAAIQELNAKVEAQAIRIAELEGAK
jgi:hypothetical protein